MDFRNVAGVMTPVVLVALSLATAAVAHDETKYPDLSGIWRKPPGIGNQWDQTKPWDAPRSRRSRRNTRPSSRRASRPASRRAG